jgi:hypothetical protein
LPRRQAISEAEHRRLRKILMNRNALFRSIGLPICEASPDDSSGFDFPDEEKLRRPLRV